MRVGKEKRLRIKDHVISHTQDELPMGVAGGTSEDLALPTFDKDSVYF